MSTRQITTVDEWDACSEAWMLVDALFRDRHLRRAYPKSQRRRKLRLFCCAIVREMWPQLDERRRTALDVAEQFADDVNFSRKQGRATERNRLWLEYDPPLYQPGSRRLPFSEVTRDDDVDWLLCPNGSLQAAAFCLVFSGPYAACEAIRTRPMTMEAAKPWGECIDVERVHVADLVREVFRCPFLPPEPLPNVGDQVRLWAKSIYDERRFEELPVLGDAVEEAGCDDARLLDHLRSGTPHVRGCWALDRVLGFV